MIRCDIAIIIYSRGREACLSRLLRDLRHDYVPCLNEAGLTASIFVYAQDYAAEFLQGVEQALGPGDEANRLVILPAERRHTRIGDVAHTAVRMVHDSCRYRLAMLMDDDSSYAHEEEVALNLQAAARAFIGSGHRAYSIKLGAGTRLRYEPFVNDVSPIIPFKEKMLWVSREVVEDVLRTPRFPELSIGEDAVISAVAWLGGPAACFGVHGLASFLHLGFEKPEELAAEDNRGGYAKLMGYAGPQQDGAATTKYDEALRTGVTPFHILPEIFVPEEHPHYEFNGIRDDVVRRMQGEGLLSQKPCPSEAAALSGALV